MKVLKQLYQKNRSLVFLLGFCFLVTISYAFHFEIVPAVDARAYDNIGWNIAQGNGYVEDASLAPEFDKAIIRVGPLFEYMLAGIYSIFGHQYSPVWVVHALLHTLSALLVYLTAKLVFANQEKRKKIALWSAGFFAFSPDLIEIAAMLMTETLYVFFFTLFVYGFVRFIGAYREGSPQDTKKGTLSVVILGIIVGLAILARPPVLFILPVVYLFFLLKKQWKSMAILTITIAVVFTPWSLQNYHTYGKFMPTGGAGVFNFWIGNHEGASGEQIQPQAVVDYIAEHGVIKLQEESLVQFKGFVTEHPGEFVKLTLLRMNRYVSIARPLGFWFYQGGVGQLAFVASSVVWSGALFVLALAGILLGLKKYNLTRKNFFHEGDGQLFAYVLSIAILTPLILFITVVESRYRFQMYPLLAIFAGYATILICFEKEWWKNKILRISFVVLLSNTLIDVSLSAGKVMEKLSGFFH